MTRGHLLACAGVLVLAFAGVVPSHPGDSLRAAALSADCTRAVHIDDGVATWAIGSALQTLRNGVHVGDGSGTVYFWSSGVLYVLGNDSRWYRWTGAAWALHGSTQPSCGTTGHKVAYWNMQYGTGVPAAAGMSCSFASDAEYATQRAGNAWGTGHLQAHLTQHVKNDAQVVAFGASEINPAFATNAKAVAAHLGWPGRTEVGDEALFARYGFAEVDSKPLTRCDSSTMYALYGRAWTNSARTDWVHVVSSHFVHPTAGSCASGVQPDDVIAWAAEKATDGKPVIIMGDLNIVVEKSEATSYFPEHVARFTNNGYEDAWRTVYPNASTHPGATSTWHSTHYNPRPNGDINDWGLWKRIDYVFVKRATVSAAHLFNHDIGDPRNCAASDHAGIVATIGGVAAGPAPVPAPAPAPALPAPWVHRDVGAVGVSGSASASSTSITVRGAGSDIWGTADAFHFVYQALAGDGSIVARVPALHGTHAWTKAGVMLRSGLTPGAAHAVMLVSAAKGVAFQRRTVTGGTSSHTDGGAGGTPVWLKLVRRGTRVTAYRSSTGATWAEVGSDTIAAGTTMYAGLAVSSHDPAVLAAATFDSVQVTPATSAVLPPVTAGEWTGGDVGAPALAGSVTVDGERLVVRGAGADIWGTADAFQFVYRRLTGDGTIVARLASLDAMDAWTKAGVMIRASLDARSAHALMLGTPGGKGLAFQRRVVPGGVSTHTGAGSGTPPVWLRLVRSGSSITASRSADGVTWTVVGLDTFAMTDSVYVGVAVSSHDAGSLATAVFEHVRITEGSAVPGWTGSDVGAVAKAGAAVFSGSTAALAGSGADIWGTADEFHYGHRIVSGNFDLIARAVTVDAVDEWTKAGVMVRVSLRADSVHASLFATPTAANGLAFQRRPIAGGVSLHAAGASIAPAAWLRLSRRGNSITAAYRRSGTDAWVTIGQEWIADLPPSVLAGLALSSHRDGTLATASFDNVQIVPVP